MFASGEEESKSRTNASSRSWLVLLHGKEELDQAPEELDANFDAMFHTLSLQHLLRRDER